MDSLGPTVFSVGIAFAVLSVVAVLLRVWARVFIVKSFGWDDAVIVLACAVSIGFSTCVCFAVDRGLGDHIDVVMALGMDNMIQYARTVWVSSILYTASLGLVKLSALALYMRLGDFTLNKLCIGMMILVGIQTLGNMLACAFQCTPLAAAYDPSIPADQKKCIDAKAWYLSNAATNILTDVLVYTLPIRLIVKLQAPRQQKAALFFALCLGLFVCISSIIRMAYIPMLLASQDPTWDVSGALSWSVIEINIGILAASISSYKSIFKKYAAGFLGTGGISSGKKSTGTENSYKMSAFKKMGNASGAGGSRAPESVNDSSTTRKPEHNPVGPELRRGNPRVDTRIAAAGKMELDNSSEEALFSPNDKIGVKTKITTSFDGSEAQTPREDV